jgi:hypothetical protein
MSEKGPARSLIDQLRPPRLCPRAAHVRRIVRAGAGAAPLESGGQYPAAELIGYLSSSINSAVRGRGRSPAQASAALCGAVVSVATESAPAASSRRPGDALPLNTVDE